MQLNKRLISENMQIILDSSKDKLRYSMQRQKFQLKPVFPITIYEAQGQSSKAEQFKNTSINKKYSSNL